MFCQMYFLLLSEIHMDFIEIDSEAY